LKGFKCFLVLPFTLKIYPQRKSRFAVALFGGAFTHLSGDRWGNALWRQLVTHIVLGLGIALIGSLAVVTQGHFRVLL